MSEIRAVALRGPFTTADLAQIAALLHRFDARNPTATFEFYAIDPDAPMFAAKRAEAVPLKAPTTPPDELL